MKRLGYRFVLRSLTHPLKIAPGGRLNIQTEWENLGVAPAYRGYQVAFELRPVGGRGRPDRILRQVNKVDVRSWLPGRHDLSAALKIPASTLPGRYHLAVGMLDPYTGEPAVQLAIQGRDAQGWYPVSQLEIVD
jgi:hypothetical protein